MPMLGLAVTATGTEQAPAEVTDIRIRLISKLIRRMDMPMDPPWVVRDGSVRPVVTQQ